MTTIIGIDPGLSGAIAIMGEQRQLFDIPTMGEGRKRIVNAAELAKIIQPHEQDCEVILENVAARPGQGVVSVFKFGRVMGIIEGIVAARAIPIHYVTPQKWKGYYGLHKDKEESRKKAIQLYPALSPLMNLKKHADRAEALLMAHYHIMTRRES